MRTFTACISAMLLLLGLSCAMPAQAEQERQPPVVSFRCTTLPPVGNPEVAKIFTRLIKPTACPPGFYPERYGSGEDLPSSSTCVNPDDFPDRYARGSAEFGSFLEPYTEPEMAINIVEAMEKVWPCPPGLTDEAKTSKDDFQEPVGIAVDDAGNVFVADQRARAILELPAAGNHSVVKPYGSNLGDLGAVAVDRAGNVFVVGRDQHVIKEILAADGYATTVTLGAAVGSMVRLAVDADDNLFAVDQMSGTLSEIAASSGYSASKTLARPIKPSTANMAFMQSAAITLDTAGNLFIVDGGDKTVKKISAADGYAEVQTLPPSFANPSGIAVDRAGNLFVIDAATIVRLDARDGYGQKSTLYTAPPGFIDVGIHVTDIALDSAGNLFLIECAFSKAPAGCGVSEIPAGASGDQALPIKHHLNRAESLAIDGRGNIYVANGPPGYTNPGTNGTVEEFLAADHYASTRTLGGTVATPAGIAATGDGDVFVTDKTANTVLHLRMSDGRSTVQVVATDLEKPGAIGVGRDGTVFVADDKGAHRIPQKGAKAGDWRALLLPGWADGIAVDRSGDVFVTGSPDSWIDHSGLYRFGPDDTTPEKLLGTDTQPVGGKIAIDGEHNLFLLDRGARKIHVSGSMLSDPMPLAIKAGHDFPFAVDKDGDIFLYDRDALAVKEILADGGYSVVRTLGRGPRPGDIPTPPIEQAPQHAVARMRCEPLPPAGTPEIAAFLSAHLENMARCPSGQFPRFYGTGEDLPNSIKCVRPADFPGRFVEFPTTPDPITDPRDAASMATTLSWVAPCPPDMAALQMSPFGAAPRPIEQPPIAHMPDAEGRDWADTAALLAGPNAPIPAEPSEKFALFCTLTAVNPASPAFAPHSQPRSQYGLSLPGPGINADEHEINVCQATDYYDKCKLSLRINRRTSRFVERWREHYYWDYVNTGTGTCRKG